MLVCDWYNVLKLRVLVGRLYVNTGVWTRESVIWGVSGVCGSGELRHVLVEYILNTVVVWGGSVDSIFC